MDKNFFKKIRILDGGMGQELLNKGLKPKGTLWSAYALINKDCHQMVIDSHLDFINAGAEVIVTNTFTARRNRLIQNDCEKYFEKINIKAIELAQKARDISKKEVLSVVDDVINLAKFEKLEGHAKSALKRKKNIIGE